MQQEKRSSLASIMNTIAHQFSVAPYTASIDLPTSEHYVLCLLDGLAYHAYLEYKSGALFLASSDRCQVLKAGFPSTTASSLTSLATGLDALEHGIVGSSFRLDGHCFNPLRWCYFDVLEKKAKPFEVDLQVPAGTWQDLKQQGIAVNGFIPAEIADSRFTAEVFSGAQVYGYDCSTDLVHTIRTRVKKQERSFTYVYFSTLDSIGHSHGVNTDEWREAFAHLDTIIQAIHHAVSDKACVLLSADHGMTHVDQSDMLDLSTISPLVESVDFMSGDIRARHIYLKPSFQEAFSIQPWLDYLGENFILFTRQEALEAKLLGSLKDPNMKSRLGDLIVLSRTKHGLVNLQTKYDRIQSHWVGHHGAMTDEEQDVPLLIWA